MVLAALVLMAAWQAAPPGEFPAAAHVVVQCVAGPNRTPTACRAVEVSHPGQGLEGAALSMVRRGQRREHNGVAEGQTFQVRIVFRLAEEGAPTGPAQSTGNAGR
ncbi:pancreas specific transcription factor, 1a-like protein [Brevundimonas subvibrioides ATCC 15264]|uniref:Pancreas specific transcription factor, 1a-like protein n=1 Tax=Brevundimonas subvibrioides (strain ATCC 15264 / DSM 4735 / LMG 14903 / NBRC 16000 / CB 81) TaxID=633149 RepID=D9QMZ3_BRESC|nr:pancreas specific transcription factor, 1a-like protein [Brevundimonas subvibrioides ATCC 15264]